MLQEKWKGIVLSFIAESSVRLRHHHRPVCHHKKHADCNHKTAHLLLLAYQCVLQALTDKSAMTQHNPIISCLVLLQAMFGIKHSAGILGVDHHITWQSC